MWKLLSGIALVVLLDIAFIWMMTAEPRSSEIARATGPTVVAPAFRRNRAPVEPIAIDDSTEPVVNDKVEIPDVRRSRESSSTRREPDRVAQPEVIAAEAAPPKLFSDTIIWIGRTEVPVKIDDGEQAPNIIETGKGHSAQARIGESRSARNGEMKKRSFQSKAFSVIKAPYNWMKALADKLH